MAAPPLSPSGISRRLSELLDQQQEPFSLHLYLVEKGCSPALLDAAVGGCGGACSTCWPWPRTRSTGRTPARPAATTKVSCASGVVRLLLCKILRGKITPPPTTKKKQLRLPAINRLRIDVDGEKQRTPGDSENSVPPPRRIEVSVVKAEEEEVEDDYSNKRLSPVSVLEQRPLEHSPPPHDQKALLIFRKLLQAAYSTALLDIFADAKDGSRSNNSNKKKNYSTSTAASAARSNHVHWEKDFFEEALAEVTDIIATEMARARAAWPRDVRPERRDVGADIAAAVLEALMEETATELMGMDDRDFAVDTARRHGWFPMDNACI